MRAVDPAEGLLRPIEFWKKGGAGTERNPPHGCAVNSPRVKRSARPAMMANGPPGRRNFIRAVVRRGVPMNDLKAKLRIGCSGWGYDDWLGGFYPPKTPKSDYLKLYSSVFKSVEGDSSF